ncbi:MAG: hypothetical protein KC516_00505 [Nanoarchaeota archaeon]|nr:hypothetical protein [Nanoarchaeota archaeon]
MRFRRGELSTQQIVVLIIVILSFAVIIFFFFRLDLGGESEKQVCHDSVMRRASLIKTSGDTLGDAISLSCKRDYVCITKSGDCDLLDARKERVETKNETYKILAEEMTSCWWMFGEGRVDYIGKTESKENRCSVCSQISFDESIKDIPEFSSGTLDKDDFYEYLANTEYSSKETYLRYLFRTSDLESLKKVSVEGQIIEGSFGKLNLDEQYFISMGITTEINSGWKIVQGLAVGLGVISLAIPGVNVATSVLIFGVGGAAFITEKILEDQKVEIGAIVVEGEGVQNSFMAPTIVAPSNYSSLNCKSIETLS